VKRKGQQGDNIVFGEKKHPAKTCPIFGRHPAFKSVKTCLAKNATSCPLECRIMRDLLPTMVSQATSKEDEVTFSVILLVALFG
jgi:hypothetical protein